MSSKRMIGNIEVPIYAVSQKSILFPTQKTNPDLFDEKSKINQISLKITQDQKAFDIF